MEGWTLNEKWEECEGRRVMWRGRDSEREREEDERERKVVR